MAVMLGAFGIYLETKLQTGLQNAAARAEAAERGATEARAQAQRELGYRNSVCAGCIHHNDAATRCCFSIDVVYADPGAPDHVQLRGGFK